MLTHMVLFNFREEVSEIEKSKILREIKVQLGQMSMVQNFRMGEALDPGVTKYSYMFAMDFKNNEALKEYMQLHHAFAQERLKPTIEYMGKLNYEIL